MNRGNGRVPCHFGQQPLIAFWSLCRAEDKKFKQVAYWNKACHSCSFQSDWVGRKIDTDMCLTWIHPRYRCIHRCRMASHVRPWTVKGISRAIIMNELISVEQPIRFVYCSLRKREAVEIPLRDTVDVFRAKGEANADFITCNNLVTTYIIRIMGSIRSRVLKRVMIVDNHS